MVKRRQATPGLIRVVIVDDHPLQREGSQTCLERAGGVEIVGSAGTANDALILVAETRPDVLLLDIHLPDRSGLEVARIVREEYPDVAILVLTGYDDPGYARTLMRLGVKGYLEKTASCLEIVDAVRVVSEGESVVSDEARRAEARAKLEGVTAREIQILGMVAASRRNAEIAEILGVSIKTVEFHLKGVFHKLGARSRVDAISKARNYGLLPSLGPFP